MRKSLLTIGSTVLIVALCTFATTSKNRVQKLDRVNYSEGNTIGATGSANGQAFAQTGCFAASGCHGTAVSKSTTGVFSGLPTNNQVTAGQTYQLTLVVSDVAATPTEKKWGFDIFSTGGTFATTNPNSEVDTNWLSNGLPGAEIHHLIAPKYTATKAAPSYTFDKMSWTAPATPGLDTFYYAANAANSTATTPVASTKDHSMLGTPIVLTVNASTTPVKLTSFNASAAGSKVNLSWTTATEVNTDHFAVERSIDGRNFSTVITLKASGNTSSTVSYASIDNVSSLSGTIYYRLKSVDKNGQFNYSAVKTVSLKLTKGLISGLYPNPAKSGQDIKVSYQSVQSGSAVINLVNTLGKKVYSGAVTVTEGTNTLSVSSSHLSPGIYYLSVSNSNGSTQKQAIVIQ